jgi:hypothetical protein
VKGVKLDIGCYYRPLTDSTPPNSLLLVSSPNEDSPILLLFGFAPNEAEHSVNDGGLRRIERLDCPPNTRGYYVLVTPRGVQPQIAVPKECFSSQRKEVGEPDEVFPVFHYPVDLDTLFPGP